jgi:hypothetical protein
MFWEESGTFVLVSEFKTDPVPKPAIGYDLEPISIHFMPLKIICPFYLPSSWTLQQSNILFAVGMLFYISLHIIEFVLVAQFV